MLAKQNELWREIVQFLSAICVDSCESIVLRQLLFALDLLDEFESEAPYHVSETDGQAYVTYPDIPFPMQNIVRSSIHAQCSRHSASLC